MTVVKKKKKQIIKKISKKQENPISIFIEDFFQNQQKELTSTSNYYYQYANFLATKDTKYYEELRTPEALFALYKQKDILNKIEEKNLLAGGNINKFIGNFINKNENTYLQIVLVKLIEYSNKKVEDIAIYFNKEDVMKLKQLSTEKEFRTYIFKNSLSQRQEFNNILNDVLLEISKQEKINKKATISKENTKSKSKGIN